jgi:trehalose-6-phosphate synthase
VLLAWLCGKLTSARRGEQYVRHFTTCCRRILGLDDEAVGAGEIYLDVDGRRVYILALHGGLDPEHIMRSLRSRCARARLPGSRSD